MSRSHLFAQFEEDPFFSSFHDRMGGLDDMFSSMRFDPFLSLTDGSGRGAHGSRAPRRGDSDYDLAEQNRRHGRSRDLVAHDPFNFATSMMSNMNAMMGNMHKFMEHSTNDPNGHVFTQSSVMSYSNVDGKGQPKIYQATTSTRQAPGGIRETHKAVRDSEAGLQKMSIGRHIQDRSHVVTRQQNMRSGEIDENQDYVNMAEEEAPQFYDEWQQKTSQFAARPGHALGSKKEPIHRAIGSPRPKSSHNERHTKDLPQEGRYAKDSLREDRLAKSSSRDAPASRKSRKI